MRAIAPIALSLVSIGTKALAAGGTVAAGGAGILFSCFLSFCALVALFQVAPLARLLAGLVKGLFHRT